jgi:hypothetical protein
MERDGGVIVDGWPVLMIDVLVTTVRVHMSQRRRSRDRQQRGCDDRGDEAAHVPESMGSSWIGQIDAISGWVYRCLSTAPSSATG